MARLLREVSVSNGTAHDFAQDVSAAVIRRSTPSAMRNVVARAWSAITRREAAPPLTFLSDFFALKIDAAEFGGAL